MIHEEMNQNNNCRLTTYKKKKQKKTCTLGPELAGIWHSGTGIFLPNSLIPGSFSVWDMLLLLLLLMMMLMVLCCTLKLSTSNTHYIEQKKWKRKSDILVCERERERKKKVAFFLFFLFLSFVSTQDNFSREDRHHTCTKIPLEKKSPTLQKAQTTWGIKDTRLAVVVPSLVLFF